MGNGELVAVEGEEAAGRRKALPGAVRASRAHYNTEEEVDRFLEAVRQIARGRVRATYEQAADGTYAPSGGGPRFPSPLRPVVKHWSHDQGHSRGSAADIPPPRLLRSVRGRHTVPQGAAWDQARSAGVAGPRRRDAHVPGRASRVAGDSFDPGTPGVAWSARRPGVAPRRTPSWRDTLHRRRPGPAGSAARGDPRVAARIRSGHGAGLPARPVRLREPDVPRELCGEPLSAPPPRRPRRNGQTRLHLDPPPAFVEPARARARPFRQHLPRPGGADRRLGARAADVRHRRHASERLFALRRRGRLNG